MSIDKVNDKIIPPVGVLDQEIKDQRTVKAALYIVSKNSREDSLAILRALGMIDDLLRLRQGS